MVPYEFHTTWWLGASVEQVWGVLIDSSRYPDWWRGIRSVDLLRAGDAVGVGQVSRLCWRGVLPYTLRFEIRVTRVQPPHLIEGEATGALEGRGVCRLFAGPRTAVVYDWRVRTTEAWMNLLGPVARPAFAWNHECVMRRGALGLAKELDALPVA